MQRDGEITGQTLFGSFQVTQCCKEFKWSQPTGLLLRCVFLIFNLGADTLHIKEVILYKVNSWPGCQWVIVDSDFSSLFPRKMKNGQWLSNYALLTNYVLRVCACVWKCKFCWNDYLINRLIWHKKRLALWKEFERSSLHSFPEGLR